MYLRYLHTYKSYTYLVATSKLLEILDFRKIFGRVDIFTVLFRPCNNHVTENDNTQVVKWPIQNSVKISEGEIGVCNRPKLQQCHLLAMNETVKLMRRSSLKALTQDKIGRWGIEIEPLVRRSAG